MKLYNTITRKIEEFLPINPNEVTMYTCGPTVYNYAHIGNLRTYVFEDFFEKTLNYLNYKVKRVMNITDVGHLTSDADTGDDKMLEGAKRENKTPYEIAEYYTKAFFNDCDKLNIKKPQIVEKATDNIEEYIKIVSQLIDNNHAYLSDGNVYFSINTFPDYYKLSGKNADDLLVASRNDIEEDKSKKNPLDFVLWFTSSKFDDQAMKWDSPWGVGYPGWHIECSGIALKYLGEYLDIHCGGIDHIFPHHTNEIAQSESFLGHKWCNYWIHGEFLNIDEGKMSKSNGDFLTLSLLEEKGYKPLEYRLFLLQSHYRNPLEFNYHNLDIAKNTYGKLKSKIKTITDDNSIVDDNLVKIYQQKFGDALGNDLSTSLALTTLYDCLKDEQLNNNTKRYLIADFDQVLSLDLLKEEETIISEELNDYIQTKIKERNIAKENKNYKLADEIRDELIKEGIKLIDTREETTYEIR